MHVMSSYDLCLCCLCRHLVACRRRWRFWFRYSFSQEPRQHPLDPLLARLPELLLRVGLGIVCALRWRRRKEPRRVHDQNDILE